MADKFNAEKVTEVRSKIEAEYSTFIEGSSKADNKAGARRARKASLDLTKSLKEYRKESIK